MSKNEWTSEPEPIKILPEVSELWFKITGTRPTKRKYKIIYDLKDKGDALCVNTAVLLEYDPFSEHERLVFEVTDNQAHTSALNDVLHHKPDIERLWELLNARLIEKPDYSCSICGAKMQGAAYCKGIGWYGLRGNRNNWTTCYKHSSVENKGEYCSEIRAHMIRWLGILKRKIARLERKSVCSQCNNTFLTTRKDSKFCSIKCRVAHHRASV
jgi:hypothetical protein